MRKHSLLAAILVVLALVTGLATAQPAAATPGHLVIIMMENHGRNFILKDPTDMPYESQLWNFTAPGVPSETFTNYQHVCHPSLPNYLAATSGETVQCGSDSVTAGKFTQPSLWGQLSAAGVTWGIFAESMPVTCSPARTYNSTSISGTYVMTHVPGQVYSEIYGTPLCNNVQPLSALDLTNLPQVSWVMPNLCNDMHGVTSTVATTYGYTNCLKGSDALEARADAWLASEVPSLVSAGATVLITYDECCGAKLGPIYTILAGAGVTNGTQVTTMLNHYGLLAGVEDAYGVPRLGNAVDATPLPLP